MFFLDFVVFPPLILACMWLAFARSAPGQRASAIMALIGGLALWTLVEYLVHRFAFHHFPLLKPIHMAHHDEPRGLTGTPTVATLVVFATLAYLPARLILPQPLALALTAGLMAGYLAYVTVHYAVHHRGSGGVAPLRRLIRLHAVHHHQTTCNFGVTTAFWDRVFGTYAARIPR